MQCPNCGNTDLSPNFKFCPECGSQLSSASSVAKKEEEAIAQTTSQQGLTGNDNDLTVDDRQIHGNYMDFSWLVPFDRSVSFKSESETQAFLPGNSILGTMTKFNNRGIFNQVKHLFRSFLVFGPRNL